MAAGDKIFTLRGAKKNTTAVTGVTHGSYRVLTSEREDPGPAAAPGPVEVQCEARKDIVVSLYGNNVNTLLALVGSAAENVIFQTVGAAAAAEKITVKSVAFTRLLGDVEIPRDGAGGQIAACGIQGRAQWGSSDTLATMIVAAADS